MQKAYFESWRVIEKGPDSRSGKVKINDSSPCRVYVKFSAKLKIHKSQSVYV